MAKKRETKRKVKTLKAKPVRPEEGKRVKAGFIWFKPGVTDEGPEERLAIPSGPPITK